MWVVLCSGLAGAAVRFIGPDPSPLMAADCTREDEDGELGSATPRFSRKAGGKEFGRELVVGATNGSPALLSYDVLVSEVHRLQRKNAATPTPPKTPPTIAPSLGLLLKGDLDVSGRDVGPGGDGDGEEPADVVRPIALIKTASAVV
ncbi:hypothetical protein B0H17DRAFT_1140079 [Mycena rosella]|uniref:Uncharacterized protein n=1 Tax=Mycena rosella TaxID=1033263 RepID=A0AAD7GAJ7_MYCRO|nr:hypothetical protein B0H17DRAFT_1140079 [Mycena rosella]